jgi:hypothetical protein
MKRIILPIALIAGSLAAVPADAALTECNGMAVTVPGATPGPDVLIGTDGPDVIAGGAGDDVIKGKGGDDVICGGKGDDEIYGGDGDDLIFGGKGDDHIKGRGGEDVLHGGRNADLIDGGHGRDVLRGNSGKDEIHGRSGHDRIRGGAGVDEAHGGPGRDKCSTSETYSSCLLGLSLTLVAELPPGHQAGVAVPPPGDSRLFVVDQAGPIWEVGPGGREPTPLVDLTGRVSTASEEGVLGLAFHPDYDDNGRFFVFSTQPDRDIVIQEFVDDGDWPIDPDTGSTVIEIDHGDATNHNGGMLLFGADGHLYASIGDGGTGGQEGQDTSSLLGTIIRLDVDSAQPYVVPDTNPFVGGPGADEIWAYGLRNPWRFAFDAGRIYIADVGESTREEVSVAPAGTGGLNYGWDILEGTDCHNPSSGCSSAGTVLPVHEEDQSTGVCSVIGGFVYRGSAMPELEGRYLFGDYCAGYVKSFLYAGGAATELTTWIEDTGHSITSFGVDTDGEIYVATLAGDLYRIDPER